MDLLIDSSNGPNKGVDVDLRDKKVGTIVVHVLNDSRIVPDTSTAVATPSNYTDSRLAEPERCYIYHSEAFGEPYYYTRAGTRVFVVDKNRIDFFPNGVEPKEYVGNIKEYYCERCGVKNTEKTEDHDEEEPQRIGSITVYVRKYKDDTKESIILKEERDVLHLPSLYNGAPFYLAPGHPWMRILIMDAARIKDDPKPTDQEEEEEEERVIQHMLEEELNPPIEFESVDLTTLGSESDQKIGTIVVQKALKPEEKVTETKEVLDVFGTPREIASKQRKAKKPYMLTGDGRRIYVQNYDDIPLIPITLNKTIRYFLSVLSLLGSKNISTSAKQMQVSEYGDTQPRLGAAQPSPPETLKLSRQPQVNGVIIAEKRDGKLNGVGEFVSTTCRIKGKFENDNLCLPATVSCTNSLYKGDLNKDRQPHGVGVKFFPNGDAYHGEFCNGEMHGKGHRLYASSAQMYDGMVSHNLPHGFGSMRTPSGLGYTGEWKNGRKEGKGTYKYTEKTYYSGYFVDDLRDGEGIMIYEDDSECSGTWRKGIREGRGIHRYKDGTVYDGEYKNDKPNGVGTVLSSDGSSYTGEWKDGRFCGRGESNDISRTNGVLGDMESYLPSEELNTTLFPESATKGVRISNSFFGSGRRKA
eukprot:gene9723-6811_t